MSQDIAIRALDPAGVALAIDWAAAEGWNPGLDDAEPFRSIDPDGFLGLFVGDAIMASISAVAYDESFAFIGFYICRRDLRGHGYRKRRLGRGARLPEIVEVANGTPASLSIKSPLTIARSFRRTARASCGSGSRRPQPGERLPSSKVELCAVTARSGVAGRGSRSGRSSPITPNRGGTVRGAHRSASRRPRHSRRAGAERSCPPPRDEPQHDRDLRDGADVPRRHPFAAASANLRHHQLRAWLTLHSHMSELVPRGGFEPPTRGFSVRCSTN